MGNVGAREGGKDGEGRMGKMTGGGGVSNDKSSPLLCPYDEYSGGTREERWGKEARC